MFGTLLIQISHCLTKSSNTALDSGWRLKFVSSSKLFMLRPKLIHFGTTPASPTRLPMREVSPAPGTIRISIHVAKPAGSERTRKRHAREHHAHPVQRTELLADQVVFSSMLPPYPPVSSRSADAERLPPSPARCALASKRRRKRVGHLEQIAGHRVVACRHDRGRSILVHRHDHLRAADAHRVLQPGPKRPSPHRASAPPARRKRPM